MVFGCYTTSHPNVCSSVKVESTSRLLSCSHFPPLHLPKGKKKQTKKTLNKQTNFHRTNVCFITKMKLALLWNASWHFYSQWFLLLLYLCEVLSFPSFEDSCMWLFLHELAVVFCLSAFLAVLSSTLCTNKVSWKWCVCTCAVRTHAVVQSFYMWKGFHVYLIYLKIFKWSHIFKNTFTKLFSVVQNFPKDRFNHDHSWTTR